MEPSNTGQLVGIGAQMMLKRRMNIYEVNNGFIAEGNSGNDRTIFSTKEEVAEFIKTYFA